MNSLLEKVSKILDLKIWIVTTATILFSHIHNLKYNMLPLA